MSQTCKGHNNVLRIKANDAINVCRNLIGRTIAHLATDLRDKSCSPKIRVNKGITRQRQTRRAEYPYTVAISQHVPEPYQHSLDQVRSHISHLHEYSSSRHVKPTCDEKGTLKPESDRGRYRECCRAFHIDLTDEERESGGLRLPTGEWNVGWFGCVGCNQSAGNSTIPNSFAEDSRAT